MTTWSGIRHNEVQRIRVKPRQVNVAIGVRGERARCVLDIEIDVGILEVLLGNYLLD